MNERGVQLAEVADHEKHFVEARVRDIENAAMRCRWVYVVLIAVSSLLIATSFNSSFAWVRGIAAHVVGEERKGSLADEHSSVVTGHPSAGTVDSVRPKKAVAAEESTLDVLRKRMFEEWVSTMHFTAPFFGAKFGAGDAGIIGAVLLAFLGTWCFFSARRENHLIYYAIRDTTMVNGSAAMKYYLRCAIVATQIFTKGKHDQPLRVADINQKVAGAERDTRSDDTLLRRVMWVMFMIPSFALAFVFVVDIYSLFTVSPFRSGQSSLFWVIVGSCDATLERCWDTIGLCIRLIFNFTLLILNLYIMGRARAFQEATSELLEFMKDWKLPLRPVESKIGDGHQ